jgi:K+-sensing histidine kinase KdpD
MICQSLIHQMGGKLEIKQTDEGQIITRLELPIATS